MLPGQVMVPNPGIFPGAGLIPAAPGMVPSAGMIPVRLRTPSGKTALFYTSAVNGVAGPSVPVAPTASVAPAMAPTADPSAAAYSYPPAGAFMTGLPPRLPAAAPAAPQVSTKQYSMPAQTTNIAADTVEVQESAEQAQELLQADTSETRETEGAPPAEETAVEEEPMPETIQSTAGAQEGPQEFRVGDMVYRNGELASIAHVDHAVHPPCYVVRMAETGQDVGCEGQNLLPVYSQGTALAAGAPQTSPTEQVFTESTACELPATVEGSAD